MGDFGPVLLDLRGQTLYCGDVCGVAYDEFQIEVVSPPEEAGQWPRLSSFACTHRSNTRLTCRRHHGILAGYQISVPLYAFSRLLPS